jgi:hypothetical protein
MCCIIGEVEKISNTNIFTALVVYSNNVETRNPVAMVLPCPTTDTSSIEMIDIKEKDFFKTLNKCFDRPTRGNLSYSTNSAKSGSFGALEVKRCGDYQYSVVPDIKSFSRLDQSIFGSFPTEFFEKFYSEKFSFLVCIIDKSAEYSPIAYTHKSNGKYLFTPCRHYHTHSNNGLREQSYATFGQINQQDDEQVFTDDWDHSIYSIDSGVNLIGNENNMSEPLEKFSLDTCYKPPKFEKFPFKNLDWSLLKKRKITGYGRNRLAGLTTACSMMYSKTSWNHS